ncbi:hypothetical protein [Listeria ilorinensis]|nr:hypothetical protein [Listeria ilorinensis]
MESMQKDRWLIVELLIAVTGFENSFFDKEELNQLPIEDLAFLEKKYVWS